MTRLPGLDLLRAIAIVWVMLFHSFLVGGLGPQFDALSRYGWAGVDMFFALSGYLIGGQLLRPLRHGQPLALGAFYARRAWRILPAYAVVLAAYVGWPALREAPGLQPWWQFASFTLNLLIDYRHNQAFSHAWSLCVEEHFYLVFPLLALVLARWASLPRLLLLYAGLVALGIAARGATWLHFNAIDPERGWFVERLYYPTWLRLDGLLVGVLLAALQLGRPQAWAWLQRRANACLLLGLLLGAAALALFGERTGLLANTLGWPLLSLAMGLGVLAGSSRHGLIGRRPLPGVGWLAAASYSLYLSHKIAFHLVHTWVLPWLPPARPLVFLAYAGATLLLGAALHHGVERPGLRWRDRRLATATTADRPIAA